MILTDREMFLIVFAEGHKLSDRLNWTLVNMKALGCSISKLDVIELIEEYDSVQADLLDIVTARRKKLENIQS